MKVYSWENYLCWISQQATFEYQKGIVQILSVIHNTTYGAPLIQPISLYILIGSGVPFVARIHGMIKSNTDW